MAFTESQQNVIDFKGKNMLVSASAGTGKTTVMIERIAKLIAEGADVSQLVVVTFTNLAAAEMKNRLAEKLAEKRSDRRIVEQLEKLDTASICTIHAFCAEILRNWFYVCDIDPSFSILDSVTAETLRSEALEQTFHEYFRQKDPVFKKVYKIFATGRKEDNFKSTLMDLYNFSRCLVDFDGWYKENRKKFAEYSDDNPIVVTVLSDIRQKLEFFADEMCALAEKFADMGANTFASSCRANATAARVVDCSSLGTALNGLFVWEPIGLGRDKIKQADCGELKTRFDAAKSVVDDLRKTYNDIGRGRTMDEIWADTAQSAELTDKLAEILMRFDEKFFDLKKQRGTVDFNDLEHLTLRVLDDAEALFAVRSRYKFVFVDEYQDTNPVQEAIVSKIAAEAKFFMVGDVKQSIYGFRGCDPTIFLRRYRQFKQFEADALQKDALTAAAEAESVQDSASLSAQNHVEELNTNFRSNREILNFVNDVFDFVMTDDFGKVDYLRTSRLTGVTGAVLDAPSVQIDLVVKRAKENREAEEIYDIAAETVRPDAVTQGDVIAQKISEFVDMPYTDPKSGEQRRLGYGDIVILLRSFKEKAVDIYNALVEHNIPVAANFKTESFANKEVRDIVNLLRCIDNPYNDIYTVGACLSPMGGFTENDLAQIKIATDTARVPFCTRMKTFLSLTASEAVDEAAEVACAQSKNPAGEDCSNTGEHVGGEVNDAFAQSKNFEKESGLNKEEHVDDENIVSAQVKEKIKKFFSLVDDLRVYSYGATVDETVLKILEKTQYHLYVQGFPNGVLRLRKLYRFIDSLKGASFAQSISKFLYFLDASDMKAEESVSSANAVRMMTMHASKGLEFPVVILADVDHNFWGKPPAVARNAEFGLAMKFYDFGKMRVYETLGARACGMYNRKNLQEEEMRLLYVAMTRAKFALDIVGTVPEKPRAKQVTSASSHLDWILAAMYRKYGEKLDDVLLAEEKTDVPDGVFAEKIALHTCKPNVAVVRERLLCPQNTDSEAVLAKLNYVYPYESQTKMPTKIVSSALDREFIDSDPEGDGSDVLYENSNRNEVGSAYHKVYQYVDFDASREQISATVEWLVSEGKIAAEIAAELDIDLIFATLRNPDLRKLTAGGRVYHEMPFMMLAPYNQVAKGGRFCDEVMLQGVIDLLILHGGSQTNVEHNTNFDGRGDKNSASNVDEGSNDAANRDFGSEGARYKKVSDIENESSAVVIDFKFSTHPSEKLVEDYRYQLRSYRLAVQKICNIQKVDCYIFSIRENELTRIDVDKPFS